jgi:hypothetical protein
MEEWLSLSSEAILVGIFVMLLLINSNLITIVRDIRNKGSQPTLEQMNKLIEQVDNVKWHIDQIRHHLKHGESAEESELKNDAQWLKSFKES